MDTSTTLAIISVVIALFALLYSIRYTLLVKRDLTLTAYAEAVKGILEIKQNFADHHEIFEKQIERNADIKQFIHDYMQHDIPAFLAFAGGMWRFSYVYSVMKRWKQLGLTKAERDGLEKEMKLWLLYIPGFHDVYMSHTSQMRAHNAEFLTYLATEVYNDKQGKPENKEQAAPQSQSTTEPS